MKIRRKALIALAFLATALPLALAGNAGAVTFNPDGAVQNAETGVWELPEIACFGVSDAYIAAGDFTLDPGAALQLTNDVSACSNAGYITYWKSGGGAAACPTESADGACCMAAGFQWRADSATTVRGCYSRFVNRVGAPAASLKYGTPENRSCLKCHNDAYMVGPDPANPVHSVAAGAVSRYLNASHKNASRKITPGMNWAQIYRNDLDEEVFGVFSKVNTTVGPIEATIDWANGKINPGSPIDWFWYWGYYFEDVRDGSDIVADEITTTAGGGIPTRNMSGCALCHATGFSAAHSVDATKEPSRTWPGIPWDGSTTYTSASGKVNLKNQYNRFNEIGASTVPTSADCAALGGTLGTACTTTSLSESACRAGGGSIPGPGPHDWPGGWTGAWTAATSTCTMTLAWTYNSWDEFGVLCSNCHNSVDGGHENNGPRKNVPGVNDPQPARGAQVNAVCMQCHGKASSGTGVFTAGLTGNFAASASISTGHPNYHGSEFLNSPHARYNGTYAEITDTTKYSSTFAATNGGCEGCHDPHGSVRENLLDPTLMGSAVAEEGLKKTCDECHTAIVSINHPTGTGFPGCADCHMPRGKHLFRIAVNNTSPQADGAYTDAAWILAGTTGTTQNITACQQCHFANMAVAQLPFTATQAGLGATNMHSGGLTNSADCLACHAAIPGSSAHHAVGANSCTVCHTTNQHSGTALNNAFCNTCHGTTILPGINHHGRYSQCIECHEGAVVPDAASNAYCMTCHVNTGEHAAHHAVPAVTAHCNSCHIPGVDPPAATNADCQQCHVQAWATTAGGTVRLVSQGVDHHLGTCTTCHEEGGAYLAIHAWNPVPDVNATVYNPATATRAAYWGINTTSLINGCRSCHATIVPTSTGDNHHRGHGSVPGTNFGGVSEANGSRGDNDPGMYCLGCHGGAAIVSGDNTTGYIMKITASGLSTTTVAVQNGRVNTSGLCMGCHEVIQSGADQDHHVGECISCHKSDGSFSGTYGAGVTSGQPSPELNSSCLTCHSTAQGAAGAINLAKLNHLPGAGTPVSFADSSCVKCHKAENPPDASWPGVAPNIPASCGQCHDAAHYVAADAPLWSNANLAEAAIGIHDGPPPSYPVTFTATSSGLTVSVAASVNCGGICPTLTYDWNWGDGSETLGGTAGTSHLYAAGGSKSIKLTVRLDGKTVGTSTRSVVLNNVNQTPVASGTATWDANTWTLSIADTSTDDGPTLQIVVNWGDGSTKTIGVGGQTFTHVYARPGTFTVTLRANDPALLGATATVFTAMPAYFTISGVVQNGGSAGLAGATVRVMRGTTLVKSIVTPVGGAFNSGAMLKPGTYTLIVTKGGYTFAKPAATLTVGPSQTGVVVNATAPLALTPLLRSRGLLIRR